MTNDDTCPKCGMTETARIDLPGDQKWTCGTLKTPRNIWEGEDCLRRQLRAARAEAERYRQIGRALVESFDCIALTHEQLCNGVHSDDGQCEGEYLHVRLVNDARAALVAAPGESEESNG